MASRIAGPQGLNRGGFRGGAFAQQGAVSQDNSLLDLAAALGATNDGLQTVVASNQNLKQAKAEGARKDAIKVKQRDALLKQEGAEEASVIQAQLAGFTSQQIGEYFGTPELVAKFEENPFILPALGIHRGRVQADETALSLTEAGIDVADRQAVNEWLATNAPRDMDAFQSQGFNEQLTRHQSQWTQRALQAQLQEADGQRVQAAATEFHTALADTDDVVMAFQALNNSRETLGITGAEATNIVMQEMRVAAEQGNVALVKALAETPRGDAPALARDTNVSATVAALVERADLKNEQAALDGHIKTRSDLNGVVDGGITEQALRERQDFQALPELYQAQLIERWRSAAKAKQADAIKQYNAGWGQSVRNEAAADAFRGLLAGEGFSITSISETNSKTGATVNISASERVRDAVVYARSLLGGNPLNLTGEDAAVYRQYTGQLARGGIVDPMFVDFFDGIGARLTPEALVDPTNAKSVAQAFTIFSNMDADVASRYVKDTKTRAMLSTMMSGFRRDPDANIQDLATNAVAMANMDRNPFTAQSKEITNAARSVKLVDPINRESSWVFFSKPGKFNPDDGIASHFIASRSEVHFAITGNREEALKMATEDFSAEHTVVNGGLLRVPTGTSSDPTTSREIPAEWAKKTTRMLQGRAFVDSGENGSLGDADITGYTITYGSGDTYIVTSPKGGTQYITAAQIRRQSDAAARQIANDEAAQQIANDAKVANEVVSQRRRQRKQANILSGGSKL